MVRAIRYNPMCTTGSAVVQVKYWGGGVSFAYTESRGMGAEGQGGQLPPNFLSQWDGYACAPLNFGSH